MIDHSILARQIAAVRDAADRIREVLPAQPEAFMADRTTREIVILNLFVALQECLSLATHWLADEGWDIPANYAGIFRVLAEHEVLDHDLAARMASAGRSAKPDRASLRRAGLDHHSRCCLKSHRGSASLL